MCNFHRLPRNDIKGSDCFCHEDHALMEHSLPKKAPRDDLKCPILDGETKEGTGTTFM